MKTILAAAVLTAFVGTTALVAFSDAAASAADDPLLPAGEWAEDSAWGDGLVEKATYDATRVIYGRSREYEATFLTNRETHDPDTWTKSLSGTGTLVWKHNQIEVMPTPNYDYKHVTTSHLTADDLTLTRLDATSQEWCGTSFHQFIKLPETRGRTGWDFFGFSYMPEAGRQSATVESVSLKTLPFNSLPLALRGYDFEAKQDFRFQMLPEQRSNRATDPQPVDAVIEYAAATDEGHQLDLVVDGKLYGSFVFATDRRHVMISYDGVDGQTYELADLDRVNYWTINE